MGMEFTCNRPKADHSYWAQKRQMEDVHLPVFCPDLEGAEMTGLPPSLSIALWFTASIWVVGIIAYAFDAAGEIVLAAAALGAIAGVAEWITRRRG